MNIIGISEQHEAHACLIRDGKLVYAIAEERLSRIKTDSGFPVKSLKKLLQDTGINSHEIDLVAFSSSSKFIWHNVLKKHAKFAVDDWIQECDEYWKPILIEENSSISRFDFMNAYIDKNHINLEEDPYGVLYRRVQNCAEEKWEDLGWSARTATVKSVLGLDESKCVRFRHEDCHKSYGYFSSPAYSANKKALIFTLEGGGDDSSATCSIVHPSGKIDEIWSSNDVMVGRLYAYITLLLGMKPGQHEYKVMGLAPYGSAKHAADALSVFRKVNHVIGTKIQNSDTYPDLYFSMQTALRGSRFDNIAFALQKYLEETVVEWVTNSCIQHNIYDVVISGGVGQNIKLAKVLAEQKCIRSIWHPPIAGDGSLGIGAAWLGALENNNQPKSLDNIYLGSEYTKHEIDVALRSIDNNHLDIVKNYSLDDAATWLAEGKICARFSGRMEFGQRALGNRSIIADPRDLQNVSKINDKIKFRDFWMPFTPTVLDEDADKFLTLNGYNYSPFMTLAYDSNDETRQKIPAVLHPADHTARPQILTREMNVTYFDLLQSFKEITGIGVLLNTSFNLHGEAIVESPSDAIDTFLKSGLDILLFDHVALVRA
ncbi:carbamoyltransferase [Alphaproteobacteria bacterium]|nr:carbamoyltransferase [Alphaproteobacteria bacterium]